MAHAVRGLGINDMARIFLHNYKFVRRPSTLKDREEANWQMKLIRTIAIGPCMRAQLKFAGAV
jgi:hypothetical protein